MRLRGGGGGGWGGANWGQWAGGKGWGRVVWGKEVEGGLGGGWRVQFGLNIVLTEAGVVEKFAGRKFRYT